MADEKEPTAQELDIQADADFEAGAKMETEEAAAITPPVEEVKPEPVLLPKYAQVTEEQLAALNKAAERTAAFEQQFSKVFGTLGDVQKIVKTLQNGTPRGSKVEIPKDAFANLEKEFPMLAAQVREGLEATLKGMSGTGSDSAEVDSTKFKDLVSTEVVKLEIEALEDAHPDWRTIVGAIDISKSEKPNPEHPFRKWLATKDAAYQTKINGTNSATILSRAIDLFKKDTEASKVVAKADPKTLARADRINGAVLPKGDNRPPPKAEVEDEFEAGFKSG